MKKTLILFVVSTLATLSGWSQVQSNQREELISRYVGEWINIDPNTRGVTKVIITQEDDLSIKAFGKCSPNDCHWGPEKLHPISASVTTNANFIPFDYCIAIWDKGLALLGLKLKVTSGPIPELHVENFNIYKDGSARNNHHEFYIMRKRSNN